MPQHLTRKHYLPSPPGQVCRIPQVCQTPAAHDIPAPHGTQVQTGTQALHGRTARQNVHAAASRLRAGFAACAAMLCLGLGAQAQTVVGSTQSSRITDSRVMPAGFLFFYDMDGQVSVQSGSQTVQAPLRQTLEATEPTRIVLAPDATTAIAFSNGVSLWAKGPGSFTISHFGQQVFHGNNRQTAYEPTSSVLHIELDKGTFAFAERNLSALSTLQLHFGDGKVLDANETASFTLQIGTGVQGNEDRISVLSGRALLRHDDGRGSAILIGSGQFLQVPRKNDTSPQQLRLPEQMTSGSYETEAQLANRARTTNERVWFVHEQGHPLYAQVVVPLNFWLSKPHAATRVR